MPYDLRITFLAFVHPNGFPIFDSGLKTWEAEYKFDVVYDDTRIRDTEWTTIHNDEEQLLLEIRERLQNCIVVGGNNPFLMDLIPPAYKGVLDKALQEKAVVFTPNLSPNPVRRQLPFLVGRSVDEIEPDMNQFILEYCKHRFTNLRYLIAGNSITPIQSLVYRDPPYYSWHW